MNKYKFIWVWNGAIKKFEHKDKRVLIALIRKFFKENDIDFMSDPEIEKQIDRQSKASVKKTKVSLSDALSGARALVKNLSGKSVSNEEIVRRANICKDCPSRDAIGGCGACGLAGKISQAANTIRAHVGAQIPIPPEAKSYFCGICNCSLSLMVVTKMEDFRSEDATKNAMRPDVCWLKTTSTNYSHE